MPKLLVETLTASSVALEELRFGRVLFDDQRLVWTDDAPADPRFANGLFARFPRAINNAVGGAALASTSANSGQWLAQLAGIATLLGFMLPLIYGVNWLVNRFYPQRVALEGERQGMDLHELGAGAYPEFITHTEEFMQR